MTNKEIVDFLQTNSEKALRRKLRKELGSRSFRRRNIKSQAILGSGQKGTDFMTHYGHPKRRPNKNKPVSAVALKQRLAFLAA